MKTKRPAPRRIRIQIAEISGTKAIPGTVYSMSLWDTSSKEVFEVIRDEILDLIEEEENT